MMVRKGKMGEGIVTTEGGERSNGMRESRNKILGSRTGLFIYMTLKNKREANNFFWLQ